MAYEILVGRDEGLGWICSILAAQERGTSKFCETFLFWSSPERSFRARKWTLTEIDLYAGDLKLSQVDLIPFGKVWSVELLEEQRRERFPESWLPPLELRPVDQADDGVRFLCLLAQRDRDSVTWVRNHTSDSALRTALSAATEVPIIRGVDLHP